jgi:hypothetical protein
MTPQRPMPQPVLRAAPTFAEILAQRQWARQEQRYHEGDPVAGVPDCWTIAAPGGPLVLTWPQLLDLAAQINGIIEEERK